MFGTKKVDYFIIQNFKFLINETQISSIFIILKLILIFHLRLTKIISVKKNYKIIINQLVSNKLCNRY